MSKSICFFILIGFFFNNYPMIVFNNITSEEVVVSIMLSNKHEEASILNNNMTSFNFLKMLENNESKEAKIFVWFKRDYILSFTEKPKYCFSVILAIFNIFNLYENEKVFFLSQK